MRFVLVPPKDGGFHFFFQNCAIFFTKYTETKWDDPPSGVGVVVVFGEYYVVVRLTSFSGAPLGHPVGYLGAVVRDRYCKHPRVGVAQALWFRTSILDVALEVSNWLIYIGYNLLINGVFLGVMTLLLTIDPNFQRDIQVGIRPAISWGSFGGLGPCHSPVIIRPSVLLQMSSPRAVKVAAKHLEDWVVNGGNGWQRLKHKKSNKKIAEIFC